MPKYDEFPVSDTVLDVINFQIAALISAEMIDDGQLEYQIRRQVGAILLSFKRTFAGQHLDRMYGQHPKDWVQAVKERFAPLWLKKRYPVQYKRWYIDMDVVYPQIKLPNEDRKFHVRWHEGEPDE